MAVGKRISCLFRTVDSKAWLREYGVEVLDDGRVLLLYTKLHQ